MSRSSRGRRKRRSEARNQSSESPNPSTTLWCFRNGVNTTTEPSEVKGRVSGPSTITVTRNEILYSLNRPEDFILAIVEFQGDRGHWLRYVRRPFGLEPDFRVIGVSNDFAELLARAEPPS